MVGSNGSRTMTPTLPAKASEIRAKVVPGRVLVVDDNAMVRDVLSRMLRMHGFDVVSAASGEEAVSTYTALSEVVDAVLLDMCMPGMDGLETLMALQEIRSDVKVLLVSGSVTPERVELALARGALGFLAKPCEPDMLVGMLARALGERISAVPSSSRHA